MSLTRFLLFFVLVLVFLGLIIVIIIIGILCPDFCCCIFSGPKSRRTIDSNSGSHSDSRN
jgi:hypothetical protein